MDQMALVFDPSCQGHPHTGLLVGFQALRQQVMAALCCPRHDGEIYHAGDPTAQQPGNAKQSLGEGILMAQSQ